MKGTVPLKDVTALHRNGVGSQLTDAQEKSAAGKAKARELGEKTFLSFKERRLRFRREVSMAAGAPCTVVAPKDIPASTNPQNTSTSVWAAVKSHMGLRAKPASQKVDVKNNAELGATTTPVVVVGSGGTSSQTAAASLPSCLEAQGAILVASQHPTELQSNPLFDDPTLRLTPRLVLGAPLAAEMAAAPQPSSKPSEGSGASSAAPAVQMGLSAHSRGKAPSALTELCADLVSVAPAQTQQALWGPTTCVASGGLQSCASGTQEGEHDGQLPPAAPLLLTAAASGASSLHSRAASLTEGQLVGQPFPATSLPITSVAGGPGRLSILYENQAMRMERAELKSELKLISARLAVLEVRSKSWGRVAPAAAKGRSQSAPRGVPRRAVPPQRAQSDTAADREQHRGRPLQRSPSFGGGAAGAAPNMAAGCAVRRPSQTRPASPQRTISLAFGSRQSSPTRAVPRAVRVGGVGAPHSGVPSSVGKHGPSSRPGTPAQGAGVAFGSRAGSPVGRFRCRRSSAACDSRVCSPAKRAADAPSDTGRGEPAPPAASPMPYRSAFIGAGRPRVQRSGSAAGAQDSRPADAEAAAGVHGSVLKEAPSDGTYGPPPPPQASRLPACPSSSERWAGPGGRLGRAPFDALAKRDGETGVLTSVLPSKLEGQRQKHRNGKENEPASQRIAKTPSAVAQTAAQLGLTLKTALRPSTGKPASL